MFCTRENCMSRKLREEDFLRNYWNKFNGYVTKWVVLIYLILYINSPKYIPTHPCDRELSESWNLSEQSGIRGRGNFGVKNQLSLLCGICWEWVIELYLLQFWLCCCYLPSSIHCIQISNCTTYIYINLLKFYF